MATARPVADNVTPLRHAENIAFRFGKILLGTSCTLIGVALSLTLFLVPVGVPLALLGIALLVTTGDDDSSQ